MHKKLRPSGGYRNTCSFQTATIIYDATYWFCEKFLSSRSRTVDQMVQAARSGRQNIAEGSRAAATSSQTELRLINVARASLEELLLDYEDFLRHRHLILWTPNSEDSMAVRNVPRNYKNDQSDLTDLSDQQRWALYAPWLENENPEVRANAIICLIHQANYLLDRQIAGLEEQFVNDGGYSEQLATARLASRAQHKNSNSQTLIPDCQKCGKPMVLRTAQAGNHAGQQFWGCSAYPDCHGTTKC
ncbi:MAG: four helix bundle suffix domain-containing protein [Kiritimatiellae bacterium]|nr:four helix bundle suffix domain-containing protein [Kiritimatiellia bacterium]